jgi:hypothetical protein
VLVEKIRLQALAHEVHEDRPCRPIMEGRDKEPVATANVVLENVVPVLTVDPFQSPIVVTQLPYAFMLSGTVSEGALAPGLRG